MTPMTSFGGYAIVKASRNRDASVSEEGDRARLYLHMFPPFYISHFLDKRSPAISWWNSRSITHPRLGRAFCKNVTTSMYICGVFILG